MKRVKKSLACLITAALIRTSLPLPASAQLRGSTPIRTQVSGFARLSPAAQMQPALSVDTSLTHPNLSSISLFPFAIPSIIEPERMVSLITGQMSSPGAAPAQIVADSERVAHVRHAGIGKQPAQVPSSLVNNNSDLAVRSAAAKAVSELRLDVPTSFEALFDGLKMLDAKDLKTDGSESAVAVPQGIQSATVRRSALLSRGVPAVIGKKTEAVDAVAASRPAETVIRASGGKRSIGVPAAATAAPSAPWKFQDDASVLAAFDEKVVGMAGTFQTIPKGKFMMGSDPARDKGHRFDEAHHEVDIEYDYEMQTTPLTWGQLLRIVDLSTTKITIPYFARDPKYADGGKHEMLQGIAVNSDHPAVNISWEDVQRLIAYVNEVFARSGIDRIVRLPSESEWEKAARADSDDPYPVKASMFGTIRMALKRVAWFSDNARVRTHAVGKKPANKFGLRDMFGNVWEWMQDKYSADYKDAPTDGSAQEKAGSRRVIRGGSWFSEAFLLRTRNRGEAVPLYGASTFGARLVRSRR